MMKFVTYRLGGAAVLAFIVLCAASVAINDRHLLRSNDKALDEEGAFHFYADRTEEHTTGIVRDEDDWAPLVGYWVGEINDDLRLLFRITPQYGEVFAYSLDQLGSLVAGSAVSFDKDGNKFRLFFSTVDGAFTGSLDEAGEVMTGTWRQGRSLPMTMRRFNPSKEDSVPREFRFLVDKIVTGDSDQLMGMVGFWSGYSNLNVETPDDPELVVVHIDDVSGNLVEPKLFLPDETPLPIGIRSFVVNSKQEVKIVLDDGMDGNAMFKGQLDGKNLTGTVTYDDTDYAPPLTLLWSEKRLDSRVEESEEW